MKKNRHGQHTHYRIGLTSGRGILRTSIQASLCCFGLRLILFLGYVRRKGEALFFLLLLISHTSSRPEGASSRPKAHTTALDFLKQQNGHGEHKQNIAQDKRTPFPYPPSVQWSGQTFFLETAGILYNNNNNSSLVDLKEGTKWLQANIGPSTLALSLSRFLWPSLLAIDGVSHICDWLSLSLSLHLEGLLENVILSKFLWPSFSLPPHYFVERGGPPKEGEKRRAILASFILQVICVTNPQTRSLARRS